MKSKPYLQLLHNFIITKNLISNLQYAKHKFKLSISFPGMLQNPKVVFFFKFYLSCRLNQTESGAGSEGEPDPGLGLWAPGCHLLIYSQLSCLPLASSTYNPHLVEEEEDDIEVCHILQGRVAEVIELSD